MPQREQTKLHKQMTTNHVHAHTETDLAIFHATWMEKSAQEIGERGGGISSCISPPGPLDLTHRQYRIGSIGFSSHCGRRVAIWEAKGPTKT
jgi:hypothetical protein